MSEVVVVFGSGPAGLLAAHAVYLAGHQPVVVSDGLKKSFITGAQFLHQPIPEVTGQEPDDQIYFKKYGKKKVYAWKVYGRKDAPCSWDNFEEGYVPVWSMEAMYDKLWEEYHGVMVDEKVDPDSAAEWEVHHPLVISTIPLPALCSRGHTFETRKIWIVEEASRAVRHNTIIYNGSYADPWYRSSSIFGHDSTEYATEQAHMPANVGRKPLKHNCDCMPGIVRAGRFGSWEKGVLVHDAFRVAMDAVTDRLGVLT